MAKLEGIDRVASALMVMGALLAVGCGSKAPPVARPVPPPFDNSASSTASRPPAPPTPINEPVPVPVEPMKEDTVASASIEELNRNSPFQPAFFELDSSELSADAQAALNGDAAIMKKYATWIVTVEGHCDERGTPEYNLALGERRALAAKNYLVSLGIGADRLRIVSYGEEFPFAAGHDEASWSKNRRAHFVITAK